MDDSSGNIDQQLLNAYRNTTYQVLNPQISIRLDTDNDDLNTFLFDNNAYSWAFISAANPHSATQLPEDINNQRHQELVEKVAYRKWRYCEAEGRPDSDDWKPERSLLILDISKKEAIKLGKAFGQNAFVYGAFEQAAELMVC